MRNFDAGSFPSVSPKFQLSIMRYYLVALLLPLVLMSCGNKGFKEISLEQGHIELVVPEGYTIRKDTAYIINPTTAHEIRTFKFTNAKDSSSAVGVAYSINANSDLVLDTFLNNMMTAASRSPKVKMKGKEVKTINGRQVGILTYTIEGDSGETDLSRIAFALLDKNIYTVNMYFKGKVKPEYMEQAEKVTNSFKIR
jgi:hypothetical protein